jgi:signal transduction histidine kinase/DNA-binding response OmpR family regulator
MNCVLIVDDVPENLYLLRALLSGYGFAVDEASNGAEALARARRNPPQLIISDLLMPVMDGYALLRQWKTDARLKTIPFVVYTATYTGPKDERLAVDLGADGFIIKPADPASFMGQIEAVLARASRGELSPTQRPAAGETGLLTKYSQTLIRKLEQKAAELEDANRALQGDVLRREHAEAEAKRFLADAQRAHDRLLSTLAVQRRVEQALTESEARLRLALEAAHMGTFDWDMPLDRITCSYREENLSGLPPSGLSGTYRGLCQQIHPADLPGLEAELARCMAARMPVSREFRVLFPDDSEQWVSVRGEFEFDATGQAVRMRGVALVVTERNRAQEAMRQKTAQLETALNMAGMGVWVWDLRTDEASRLEGCGPVTGLPACEFPRTEQALLALVHPDDRALVAEKVACARTGVDYDAEFRIVLPTSEVRWAAVRGRCFRNAAGAPEVLTGLDQDITEQKRLEERLRHSQKMEAIGQLAGGIAHDFNNIIAAIGGNAELARLDLDPKHPALVSIHEILRAGQRAKDLIHRILAFGRPQAHKLRTIQLQPVLEEAERLLHATLPAGVEMVVRCAPNLPPVRADASQIHQIVLNLVTNAWHAMESKLGRIEVRLDACRVDSPLCQRHPELHPGTYLRMTFRDTGKGMDAATLEHIFEPFFTTKQLSQGAGLGLSVVHGIVRGHGGAIVAESEPGQGASFQIYLPAASELEVGTGSSIESIPAGGICGHGEHILYVDDEESLVYLAVRSLERGGYRVDGFTRVKEALLAFRAKPEDYDVVITDYNMPGMSGMELAEQLMIIRPDAPIALTSGYLRPAEMATARALGIREVIPKPYLIEELGPLVQRMLSSRSDTAELH